MAAVITLETLQQLAKRKYGTLPRDYMRMWQLIEETVDKDKKARAK